MLQVFFYVAQVAKKIRETLNVVPGLGIKIEPSKISVCQDINDQQVLTKIHQYIFIRKTIIIFQSTIMEKHIIDLS